jgi:hypothetical protein
LTAPATSETLLFTNRAAPAYVPYHLLDDRPNVIVDGAAHANTVLTLSHWPASGSPPDLAADLSAQIVFNYLDRPERRVGAVAVSNNHFDEDGLVAMFAALEPDAAQQRRDLLVDIASAGDFGTYRDRRAVRAAFAISAYADPQQSPLGVALAVESYQEQMAALYRELLPRVPELADHVDRYRRLWEREDALLAESESALADGRILIEEVPVLDLAVVIVPERWHDRRVHRTAPAEQTVHPVAVHSATERSRLLLVQGRRYRFRYRYETWVRYVSRRPLPRVDLAPLTARLSERERHGHWQADAVSGITPGMLLVGAEESSIDVGDLRAELERYLADAPPAWSPYR